MQVVYHIAQRLEELHALRYVHRDLKPGNVLWLPRTNRWTVIDFGCAVRAGHSVRIGATLQYSAPEVVRARRDWQDEMVAEVRCMHVELCFAELSDACVHKEDEQRLKTGRTAPENT